MRITIIGTGYVGLVSGACLADFGHAVVCVDTDEAKIRSLSAGHIPIFEPGLQELVAANLKAGRLSFTTSLTEAMQGSAAIFVCVGTPTLSDGGNADMRDVYEVVRAIAGVATGFTVVVMKSTIPIGSGDKVAELIRQCQPDADIALVFNPEFLREGSAIRDFKQPDRIVIGAEDARARDVMAAIYQPLSALTTIMTTDRRTAELIKYASNAFLATKISFINEIADLCEKTGASVLEVARGMGLDTRIGPHYLQAGPGYGGSCFPKDTLALLATSQDYGAPLRIVEAAVAVNNSRKHAMAHKIITAMGGKAQGKTVALLGLTFKPDTDDMREAPSIEIIAELQNAGAVVRAYDPQGMTAAAKLLLDVHFVEDAYACVADADAVVLVTEWESFKILDLERIHGLLKHKMFVDLRNLYSPAEMAAAGFAYTSVGRPQ